MSNSDANKTKQSSIAAEETLRQYVPPAPGALTYNDYLKVKELTDLQVCQSEPPHHDEPLFIIIHQTYELWFKLILHEIDEVFVSLQERRIRKATFYMRRVIAIMKLLVQQIRILETMTPKSFLGFRYNLSPASGFGSSQFREIEFAAGAKHKALLDHFQNDYAYPVLKKRFEAPSLGDLFYQLLREKGFVLPESNPSMTESEQDAAQDKRISELLVLYDDDDDNWGDYHDFAETLIELDQEIFLWRANHVTVVERMIGFKRGTGGSEGVGYLQSTLNKRCFPDLWKLRTFLEQPSDAPTGTASASATGEAEKCPFH